MSSRDLSRVVKLSCKAFDLEEKGHYARAVEKGAAAIAAAQELAQEDCLVVTHLQFRHLCLLTIYADTPGVSDEAASAADKQRFQILLAAMATLERRREAGTLLAGVCRSWPEEEWYGQFMQHRRHVKKPEQSYTPEQLARLVQFVGYDAYLFVAGSAIVAASEPLNSSLDVLAFAGCLKNFALAAFDLFEQPRRILWRDIPLASEVVFSSTMQALLRIRDGLRSDSPLPELMVELLTRWQRIERSDVLQQRGIGADGARLFNETAAAREAAVEARLASATLRCCSLGSCAARELHPSHFKLCGSCKTVAYCCREHQLKDWPAHKAACKAARKPAAAEGGSAT
jgi:hypothetical protein